VQGTAPDGSRWEQRAIATRTTAPAATAIWARAHLRDLEDQYAVGGQGTLEQRIVATSLRHGVLCRFTAFVAVDSRVVTDGTTPHKVVQPVEQPSGWVPQAPPVVHATFAAPRGTARAMVAPAAARRPMAAPPAPGTPLPPGAPLPAAGSPAGPEFGNRGNAAPEADRSPGGQGTNPFYSQTDEVIAASTATPLPGEVPAAMSPAEVLLDVRRRMGEEVARLTAGAGAAEAERWERLSELHRRLLGHLGRLRAAGLPTEPLAELATALEIAADRPQRTPDRLAELWDQTVQTLTAFARPPRRAFWKRSL